MEYNINKGIGRNVEFNGLQAQYLYFFVGGLLAIFLLFVIFYMIGIDRWFCIGFGVLSAFSLVLLWFDFLPFVLLLHLLHLKYVFVLQ